MDNIALMNLLMCLKVTDIVVGKEGDFHIVLTTGKVYHSCFCVLRSYIYMSIFVLVSYVDTNVLYKKRDQDVFTPFDTDLKSR